MGITIDSTVQNLLHFPLESIISQNNAGLRGVANNGQIKGVEGCRDVDQITPGTLDLG